MPELFFDVRGDDGTIFKKPIIIIIIFYFYLESQIDSVENSLCFRGEKIAEKTKLWSR